MKLCLRFASLINRAGCRLNAFLFRTGFRKAKTASLPVISVGNTGFGGSGKTPLVLHLLEELEKKGCRTAVVTRGYRGAWEKKGGVVSDGKEIKCGWKEAGDEPYMIALRRPQTGVYVGRNRHLSCKRAKQDGFRLVVLDDGFQHLRLKRDVDIVIHQPEKIELRESPAGLGRADVILTGAHPNTEEIQALRSRFPRTPLFPFSQRTEGLFGTNGEPIENAPGPDKKVTAFCGIAQPDRFRRTLEEMGIRPQNFIAYPDHHPYPAASIDKLRDLGGEQAVFLTTEKDIHKIGGGALEPAEVYYLRIAIGIQAEFFHSVWERLPGAEKLQEKG